MGYIINYIIYSSLLFVTIDCHLTLAVSRLQNLSHVEPHHLSCQRGFLSERASYTEQFKIYSINPSPIESTIKGYLCMKKSYYVTCSENFWGVKNIVSGYDVSPIIGYECDEAISKWTNNLLDQSTTVYQSCSWMGVNTETKIIYQIKIREVQFDSYSATLKDSILLSGSCNSRICKTVYDNVLFVTTDELKSYCPKNEENHVTVTMTKPYTKADIYLSSDYIPTVNLEGACYNFDYCGKKGFILRSGHFVMSSGGFPSELIDAIVSTPICPSNSSIISNNLHSLVIKSNINLENLFFLEKCEEILNNIRQNKNISLFDLGFLNPHISGNAYGYTKDLRNNLQISKYVYYSGDSVLVDCFDCNNCTVILIRSASNKTINKDVMSCNCNNFTGCHLPNGFIAFQTYLYNPLSDLNDEMYRYYMGYKIETRIIPHINSSKFQSLSLSGQHNHPIDHSKNAFVVLQSETEYLWNKLKLGIIYSSTIILSIMLLWLLIKLRKAFHSKKSKPYNSPTAAHFDKLNYQVSTNLSPFL